MVMHSAGSGARPLGLSSVGRPVQRALDAAGAAFQRHPFLIKTVTSAFGFAFGDVLFQLGTTARPRRRPATADHPPAAAHPQPNAVAEALQAVDWRRAAAMGGAGLALAGPLGYALIMWMEGNLFTAAPHSKLALSVKLTLDQVLGFALWHGALAAIYEPHRQACLSLLQPKAQAARKAAPAAARAAGKKVK